MELLPIQYFDLEPQKANTITRTTITRHPDLAGAFVGVGVGSQGALPALEAAGKLDQVKTVAFDAFGDNIKALRAGRLDAVVSVAAREYGVDTVKAALDALAGKACRTRSSRRSACSPPTTSTIRRTSPACTRVPPSSPVLELRGISKSFGRVEALRGVDLTLQRGEVHAVMGDNGAGKSTLLKVAAGVIRPDDGEVLTEGEGRSSALPSTRAGSESRPSTRTWRWRTTAPAWRTSTSAGRSGAPACWDAWACSTGRR